MLMVDMVSLCLLASWPIVIQSPGRRLPRHWHTASPAYECTLAPWDLSPDGNQRSGFASRIPSQLRLLRWKYFSGEDPQNNILVTFIAFAFRKHGGKECLKKKEKNVCYVSGLYIRIYYTPSSLIQRDRLTVNLLPPTFRPLEVTVPQSHKLLSGTSNNNTVTCWYNIIQF